MEDKCENCLCGSDDVRPDYDGYWTVECGNCGAVGPAGETESEAIRKWNQMVETGEPIYFG